jgi:diguanylate cyclase (GGDEF)-like protein
LYNRRGFELLVERQLQLNRRYHFLLGLFYLYIDNMKLINDHYGHQEGDKALELVANACRAALRDSDIACRLGGDEFVVACALTKSEDIEPLVERMTRHVQGLSIEVDGRSILVELSLGFVTNNNDKNLHELLAEADSQMYKAKQARKKAI